MASVRQFPTIKAVRSFVIGGVGSGIVQIPCILSFEAEATPRLTVSGTCRWRLPQRERWSLVRHALLDLHVHSTHLPNGNTLTRICTMTQAYRLAHLNAMLAMGAISQITYQLGDQRLGLIPHRTRSHRWYSRLCHRLRRSPRVLARPPAL